jgi:hypothetical protein
VWLESHGANEATDGQEQADNPFPCRVAQKENKNRVKPTLFQNPCRFRQRKPIMKAETRKTS